MRRPPAVVAVLGLLAAVLVVGGLTVPAAPATPDTPTAAVVGATAVCPDLRQDGTQVTTRVSVGVAAAPAGASASGESAQGVTAEPLARDELPDEPVTEVPLSASGQVAGGVRPDVTDDALVVTGRGALAAGLDVAQLTRSASGAERGFAGLRCEPPRTDAWFVGGATVVGDTSLLLLANPDDTPALVDVTVWTATGPVEARPGRGVVVPARGRTSLPLDELAPDRDLLALRVRAQRGRVVPALRHARFDGRTPRGVEWVPQAPAPARDLVVPGLPRGPGRRTVLVTNPGQDDAVVTIELTTGDGQFVPGGLDALPVPAGTSVAAEVSDALAATPAAARVTSDVPVLAAGFVYDLDSGDVREMAYAAAAAPLAGPALALDVPVGGASEAVLLLSALQGDARVEVTPVPLAGTTGEPVPGRTVEVPGGRTVGVPLSEFLRGGTPGRVAVEVRPAEGSGPVHAARSLRERAGDGPLTTITSLQGADARVPRPRVVRDPGVAGGG